ncbi:MAG: pyruvate, phosphate dikinase [Candidatus Woesearchaeota archaeon]|nr:MAG: pyruvate, phosphate dikinase [Candidatus Woesearchaeota archaeon]
MVKNMKKNDVKESKFDSKMKMVYSFEEGNKDMKNLLGGKGANLAEMTRIGIPVPPGFTITTEACHLYYENNKKFPIGLKEQVDENIKILENKMNSGFGDVKNPLLLSVRSGAASSMPGMMDTILNLGINDTVVQTLINKTKNERFAWDTYRRFIQMFGDVVMGVPHHDFEVELQKIKDKRKVHLDTELNAADLKELVKNYKSLVLKVTKKSFPEDPRTQLYMAIEAVFGSWNNPRAIAYRKLNDITGLKGTAVNIQAMVFGNMGESSGTGVCFSRNPSTGENKFYGEYLMNAQGEDVVAGIRTPKHIEELQKQNPQVYNQLVEIKNKLENHFKDMQDMEFTIQEGKLYILQTRNGKRTAQAAVKIAVDMVNEKLIDKKTAILRVQPESLDQLLHKQIDPESKKKASLIAIGLPASPGAAVGRIVFNAARAEELSKKEKVILVRTETSPEDLIGMSVSQGILTARGGMTSHAAVVARGMGKCCVSGCQDINIDEKNKKLTIKKKNVVLKELDYITLDGSSGEVFNGKLPLVDPKLSGDFIKLMKWADEFRKLKIRTNADIPRDARVAREFGAEGIGLCRTEHMFFEGDRILAMRQMILATNEIERRKALAKLLPYQKADFIGLFKEMNGLPVTIRLLDPPLHEFLPKEKKEIEELAKALKVDPKWIAQISEALHEVNPMLGHRGCRLGITYPEITEMQVQAIMEAACELKKKGIDVKPEIMVPLVGKVEELKNQKAVIQKVAGEIMKKYNVKIDYMIGTMIEVPRAALTADEIAQEAEFFSFGTNDLTQMTLGFSRDDIGKFLPEYLKNNIYDKDPFAVLDQKGVGQLVKMAAENGRKTRSNIKLGICGEHGGEPSSIEFCHRVGLNYVSCSPYRVPIARLAAAHAALKN